MAVCGGLVKHLGWLVAAGLTSVLVACGGGGGSTGNQTPPVYDNNYVSKAEVTTIAGTSGIKDGVGSAARFGDKLSLAKVGDTLYVADSDNGVIRKLDLSSREVTSYAGKQNQMEKSCQAGTVALADAEFFQPRALVSDGSSNLYFVDSSTCIRQIDLINKTVTNLAGSTSGVSGKVDGVGTQARFNQPISLALDGSMLYLADSHNFVIRKLELDNNNGRVKGRVSTLSGISAYFNTVITMFGGNLYVNGTFRGVHRIEPANNYQVTNNVYGGECTELSSNGSDLYCVNPDKSLYKITPNAVGLLPVNTDSGSGGVWSGTDRYEIYQGTAVRKVTAANERTILAGIPQGQGGIGSDASINLAGGLVLGDYLYAAEPDYYTLRRIKIAANGVALDKPVVETWAGKYGVSGTANGDRLAAALFEQPGALASDGSNLYVLDGSDHDRHVRKIDQNGVVSTFAWPAGQAAATHFIPSHLVVQGNYLYALQQGTATGNKGYVISRVNLTTQETTVFSGKFSNSEKVNIDGPAGTASYAYPSILGSDGKYLYLSTSGTKDYVIRKVDLASGAASTLKIGSSPITDVATGDVEFGWLTTDGSYLYVAAGDFDLSAIYKINLATGAVLPVAGDFTNYGLADGIGSQVRFDGISMLVYDKNTNALYVADKEGKLLRKITKF